MQAQADGGGTEHSPPQNKHLSVTPALSATVKLSLKAAGGKSRDNVALAVSSQTMDAERSASERLRDLAARRKEEIPSTAAVQMKPPNDTSFNLQRWYKMQQFAKLGDVKVIGLLCDKYRALRMTGVWSLEDVRAAPGVLQARLENGGEMAVYDCRRPSRIEMRRYLSMDALLIDIMGAVVEFSASSGEVDRRIGIARMLDGVLRHRADVKEEKHIWKEVEAWIWELKSNARLSIADKNHCQIHLDRCDARLAEFRERFVVRLLGAQRSIHICTRNYFPCGTLWRNAVARELAKVASVNAAGFMKRLGSESRSYWTDESSRKCGLGISAGVPFVGNPNVPANAESRSERGDGASLNSSSEGAVIEAQATLHPKPKSWSRLAAEKAKKAVLNDGEGRPASTKASFNFTAWYEKEKLAKMDDQKALGVIMEKFRSMTSQKGCLMEESDRPRIKAKMADGGYLFCYRPTNSAEMRSTDYRTTRRFFADLFLRVIFISACAEQMMRQSMVAGILVACERMKKQHGKKNLPLWQKLESLVHGLVKEQPLDIADPRDLEQHLRRCDTVLSTMKKIASTFRAPRTEVCSILYFPEGTVWRQLVTEAIRTLPEGSKGGKKILGSLRKRMPEYTFEEMTPEKKKRETTKMSGDDDDDIVEVYSTLPGGAKAVVSGESSVKYEEGVDGEETPSVSPSRLGTHRGTRRGKLSEQKGNPCGDPCHSPSKEHGQASRGTACSIVEEDAVEMNASPLGGAANDKICSGSQKAVQSGGDEEPAPADEPICVEDSREVGSSFEVAPSETANPSASKRSEEVADGEKAVHQMQQGRSSSEPADERTNSIAEACESSSDEEHCLQLDGDSCEPFRVLGVENEAVKNPEANSRETSETDAHQEAEQDPDAMLLTAEQGQSGHDPSSRRVEEVVISRIDSCDQFPRGTSTNSSCESTIGRAGRKPSSPLGDVLNSEGIRNGEDGPVVVELGNQQVAVQSDIEPQLISSNPKDLILIDAHPDVSVKSRPVVVELPVSAVSILSSGRRSPSPSNCGELQLNRGEEIQGPPPGSIGVCDVETISDSEGMEMISDNELPVDDPPHCDRSFATQQLRRIVKKVNGRKVVDYTDCCDFDEIPDEDIRCVVVRYPAPNPEKSLRKKKQSKGTRKRKFGEKSTRKILDESLSDEELEPGEIDDGGLERRMRKAKKQKQSKGKLVIGDSDVPEVFLVDGAKPQAPEELVPKEQGQRLEAAPSIERNAMESVTSDDEVRLVIISDGEPDETAAAVVSIRSPVDMVVDGSEPLVVPPAPSLRAFLAGIEEVSDDKEERCLEQREISESALGGSRVEETSRSRETAPSNSHHQRPDMSLAEKENDSGSEERRCLEEEESQAIENDKGEALRKNLGRSPIEGGSIGGKDEEADINRRDVSRGKDSISVGNEVLVPEAPVAYSFQGGRDTHDTGEEERSCGDDRGNAGGTRSLARAEEETSPGGSHQSVTEDQLLEIPAVPLLRVSEAEKREGLRHGTSEESNDEAVVDEGTVERRNAVTGGFDQGPVSSGPGPAFSSQPLVKGNRKEAENEDLSCAQKDVTSSRANLANAEEVDGLRECSLCDEDEALLIPLDSSSKTLPGGEKEGSGKNARSSEDGGNSKGESVEETKTSSASHLYGGQSEELEPGQFVASPSETGVAGKEKEAERDKGVDTSDSHLSVESTSSVAASTTALLKNQPDPEKMTRSVEETMSDRTVPSDKGESSCPSSDASGQPYVDRDDQETSRRPPVAAPVGETVAVPEQSDAASPQEEVTRNCEEHPATCDGPTVDVDGTHCGEDGRDLELVDLASPEPPSQLGTPRAVEPARAVHESTNPESQVPKGLGIPALAPVELPRAFIVRRSVISELAVVGEGVGQACHETLSDRRLSETASQNDSGGLSATFATNGPKLGRKRRVSDSEGSLLEASSRAGPLFAAGSSPPTAPPRVLPVGAPEPPKRPRLEESLGVDYRTRLRNVFAMVNRHRSRFPFHVSHFERLQVHVDMMYRLTRRSYIRHVTYVILDERCLVIIAELFNRLLDQSISRINSALQEELETCVESLNIMQEESLRIAKLFNFP